MCKESGSLGIVRSAAAAWQPCALRQLLWGAVAASLTGCVITGGAVHTLEAGAPAQRIESRPSRNAGEVAIYDEATRPARSYRVVANVTAWGRILTAISSRPTRGDIDEELRAKAAKLGADAIINVHYHTSRAGIWPRGYMNAAGQAVVFSAP